MLAATFQTAAFVFLLLVALLVVSVFIAFTAPALGRAKPGFTTVLLYFAAEFVGLIAAIWIVAQVSSLELLPVLIALAIAAVVFAPQLVAKIPLPAAVTGLLGKK
jgi:hypothetical protein